MNIKLNDLKKLTAIAVTCDATNIDWYVIDEDFEKEPSYDRMGYEKKHHYDVSIIIKKLLVGRLEEDDEFLQELSALKAGDTLVVNSILLEESTSYGDRFSDSEKRNLKINKVTFSRDGKYYEATVELATPLVLMYQEDYLEEYEPEDYDR